MPVNLPTLGAGDLRAIARNRVGLVVGPSVTTSDPGFMRALKEKLADTYTVPAGQTYRETAESAIAGGANIEAVRSQIRRVVVATAPSPHIRTLARIRWSAILSLSMDKHFEEALVARCAAALHGRDVTVISNLLDGPPAHSVPVFKLLGACDRGDIVATPSDLLRRTPLWPRPVHSFLDAVRASPILCLGLTDSEGVFEMLAGHLFASPSRQPARLVFLADDAIVHNPRLRELMPPQSAVVASGSLADICAAMEPATRNLQLSIPFGKGQRTARPLELEQFSAIFDVVAVSNAEHAPPDAERARLLDYLFMPDVPNWEPYAADLDFPRTATVELGENVKRMCGEGDSASLVVLHGRAGSGKTVVLRRVAYDLSANGYVVGWLKRYWHADQAALLDKLFHELRVMPAGTALVLFADDPVRLGTIQLSDVFAAAERHGVHLVLVVGIRTSEYRQRDLTALCSEVAEEELADELDDDEVARFPAYLTKVGAPVVEADVSTTLESSKTSRDTLAALYLLLPSTRHTLSASVQDEFLRFGEPGGFERLVIGNVERSAKTLQDAYAMAAVSMRYGAPLPIEVLVSALGVSYSQWVEIISAPGPAWGVLYPDERNDLEGACYRPRNEIVTQLVLKLINGGTLQRDGEVGVLKRLMAACTGSSDVYREFCRKVLTARDRLDGLSATQGIELFDAALRALPREDTVLLHHKGRWLRKVCDDPDAAITLFTQALAAQGGQIVPDEPPQLIHTSIAAALFNKIDKGSLPLDEGKKRILGELEQSKDIQFINANSAHVFARLMSKLAKKHPEGEGADRAALLNMGLSEIDRTLLLLRASRIRVDRLAKDAQMLTAEKDRILLEAGTVSELEARATELWEKHKNQSGFALAIRKRMAELLGQADMGSKYHDAFTHWQRYCEIVGGLDALSPELAEVGLALYYDWQIRPRSVRSKKASGAGLKWELIESAARMTLGSDRYKDDPLYSYLRALALAHMDRWDEAELAFGRIRRLKMNPSVSYQPRDYLLAPFGTPRKLQGRLKPGASQAFFVSDDLKRSFPADLSSPWGTADVHHAYLVFSFSGPKATLDEHRVPQF